MSELRFDWYPVLHAEKLKEFAQQVTNSVNARYTTSRGADKAKRESDVFQATHHLLSALYSAYTAFTVSNCVSFPKGKDYYNSKKINSVPYPYRYTVKKVYPVLCSLNWVAEIGKSHDGKHTRIEATGDLKELFDELGHRWYKQVPIPKSELLVLRDVERDSKGTPIRSGQSKDTKKFDMPVPASTMADQQREKLFEINTLLLDHCFDLDLSDSNLGELRSQISANPAEQTGLNLHRVQLTRIFSRGCMKKGGRFHRGWWQSIPAVHRPHIRIDEKSTIEVDFSGIALRIIFAQLGVDFPASKDPYDLGLPNWEGKDDKRRKPIKKALNALINDEDGIYKLPEEYKSELGLSDRKFRQRVKDTHPELHKELSTDIGLKAQYVDSQIAEAIMLDFLRDGTGILPIHDSFIVPAGSVFALEEIMKKHFRDLTGVEVSVETDVVKSDEHFGQTSNDMKEASENPESNCVNGSDIKLDQLLDTSWQDTFIGRFRKSWLEQQTHKDTRT